MFYSVLGYILKQGQALTHRAKVISVNHHIVISPKFGGWERGREREKGDGRGKGEHLWNRITLVDDCSIGIGKLPCVDIEKTKKLLTIDVRKRRKHMFKFKVLL